MIIEPLETFQRFFSIQNLIILATEKIHIEHFIDLAKHAVVFDVRSPGEYNHAHLPGAISLPLFTDEERKEVGTTYKQKSREEAIRIGLDFFGPKMRTIVETVEKVLSDRPGYEPAGKPSQQPEILLYCWRGGMRSAAMAWLLETYGFKTNTLLGGYKKFRQYVLDTFTLPFQFRILGGYTGSGKTETLRELDKQGQAVVDLEGLAHHKGSAFGNIGLPPQPSQEMFENKLAYNLRKLVDGGTAAGPGISHSPYTVYNTPIWLEDESQRIGNVNIPNAMWATMRKSKLYFLEIPFEERLAHLVEEYGQLDRQRLIDAIGRISTKLGGLNARMAIQFLEEGNTLESFRILLKYYDKLYLKGLHNREGLDTLLHTIECNTVTTENAQQLVA